MSVEKLRYRRPSRREATLVWNTCRRDLRKEKGIAAFLMFVFGLLEIAFISSLVSGPAVSVTVGQDMAVRMVLAVMAIVCAIPIFIGLRQANNARKAKRNVRSGNMWIADCYVQNKTISQSAFAGESGGGSVFYVDLIDMQCVPIRNNHHLKGHFEIDAQTYDVLQVGMPVLLAKLILKPDDILYYVVPAEQSK